ncbi:MAG: hypothetical protein QOH49_768 [Acidobacteriota bacterium]|jgi:hypothetical protein|nr:hypothetical protein [Acidobacteriota bacterium]
MRKDFTGVLARLLLAATLLCASAAAGIAAPRGGGANACPLSRLHDCCKKMRRVADAPRLAPVQLCCITDLPQPAPAGTSYNAPPAPGAASDPRTATSTATPAHAPLHAHAHAPTFSPTHSPPAYLRHASFLI